MQILSASYLTSSPSVEKCPPPDRPEFAFIGRSNVGKSSLINMICNNQHLAKTSAKPGKTQLINHFTILTDKRTSWYLVDLPGYGFAVVSQKQRKSWENMIRNYIRQRTNLKTLFVLVDSRHSPQVNDLEFIDKLGEWGIPFAIVFTKTDKNKPAATERNVNQFLKKMQEKWEAPPVFFLSSTTEKLGKEEILDYIGDVTG